MALGDFLTGFTEHQMSDQGALGGELEDIQNRKKTRLMMQMKSALIEQELQAKQAAFDYENRLPPGLGQEYASHLGFKEAPQNLAQAKIMDELARGRNGGRGFAGDQPISEAMAIDLEQYGRRREAIKGMTRADMAKYNLEPHPETLKKTQDAISVLERMPQYKAEVERSFAQDPTWKRYLALGDNDIAKLTDADLAAARDSLVSMIAPTRVGLAQTAQELANVRTLIGSWRQGREPFLKQLDKFIQETGDSDVIANLNSGRLGRMRGLTVDRYNAAAKNLGRPAQPKSFPWDMDMYEPGWNKAINPPVAPEQARSAFSSDILSQLKALKEQNATKVNAQVSPTQQEPAPQDGDIEMSPDGEYVTINGQVYRKSKAN